VVVFFRRTRLDTRPWHTLIAPAIAAVLIAALAVLVLTNFTLLIGGSAAAAVPLILSVPLVLLLGVALESVRPRTADPDAVVAAPSAPQLSPTASA
jgi:hypothetical protein